MNDIFYAVQMWVDGFGHDTATMICFFTREEAENWIEENTPIWEAHAGRVNFEIVEQMMGLPFEEYWN